MIKYLIVLAIAFLIGGFIFVLVMKFQTDNQMQNNKQANVNQIKPQTSPTPASISGRSYSASNNFRTILHVQSKNNSCVISLTAASYTGIRFIDENNVTSNDLFTITIPKNCDKYAQSIKEERSSGNVPYADNPVIFSSKEDKLALYIPGQLILLNFTYIRTEQKIMKISKKQDIALPEGSIFTNFFFSGNENFVYFSNLKINILNGKVDKIDAPYRIYPIPNSDGYAYTENDISTEQIVLVDNNSIRKLVSNTQFDYPGKVMFSPNGKYICVEHGGSGYWGYSIYKVSGDQLITLSEGPQYSYCKRWIDNSKIFVEEYPYDEFIKAYYIFDTSTSTRLFVTEKSLATLEK